MLDLMLDTSTRAAKAAKLEARGRKDEAMLRKYMEATPLSHRHGANTEVEAARTFMKSGGTVRRAVLLTLLAAGPGGMTGSEMIARVGRKDYTVRPRLTELKESGLALPTSARRRNPDGNREVVWTATMRAVRLVKDHTGGWAAPWKGVTWG